MAKKYKIEDIINIVLELNIIVINKPFKITNTSNKLLQEILTDFS